MIHLMYIYMYICSMELNQITQQNPEPEPEPDIRRIPDIVEDDNKEYSKDADLSALSQHYNVVSATKDDIHELFEKPTTSPTIQQLEKEQRKQKEQPQPKDTPGPGLTDIADEKDNDKKDSLTQALSDEDLDLFSEVLVEGIVWMFESGLSLAGREGTVKPDRKQRLIRVYSRVLKSYDIKMSPVWIGIIMTVIVFGFSVKDSKPKTEKHKTGHRELRVKRGRQENPEQQERQTNRTSKAAGAANMM